MSYSTCLKCGDMVGWYDKYCSHCQKKFGLPNLSDWQKTNFIHQHENWADWVKKEVEKDMAKIKAAGKQELLNILETAFRLLLKDINYKETRAKYEQAKAEIVALIKKEVPSGPVDK